MKEDTNPRIDTLVKAVTYGTITGIAIALHNLVINIYQNIQAL